MTVERQYRKIIFICDVESSPRCEGQIETGEEDFGEALAAARREGWDVSKGSSGDWIHHCGNCLRPR